MTRISSALNSDDLSQQERPCDVDTVRALGLVGINRPLGVLIIEVMEACAGDGPHAARRLADLVEGVRRIVHRQAIRDKIRVDLKSVAELVVKEMVLDRCERCQGRGFLPLAYGPDSVSSDRGAECPTCFGSGRGRRDLGVRARAAGLPEYTIELKRFWEAVEGRLAEAEMTARWRLRKRFF